MRGGFTDPWPTPRIPPKPPCLSCASVQTLHVSPTVFAIAWASLAIAAGGRSPAGVFTRSRAQQTASATISPASRGPRDRLRVPPARDQDRRASQLRVGRPASCSDRSGRRPARSPRRRPGPRRRPAGPGRPGRTSSRRWETDARRRALWRAMRRIVVRSNSSFGPTPTSSTASAANRSPRRRVTSSVSPFLPVSRAAA